MRVYVAECRLQQMRGGTKTNMKAKSKQNSEESGKIQRSVSMIIDKLMDDEPQWRPLLDWIVDDKADFWDCCRLVEGAREQGLHFLCNNC